MDLKQSKQDLDGALLALWMVPEVDKEYTVTKQLWNKLTPKIWDNTISRPKLVLKRMILEIWLHGCTT